MTDQATKNVVDWNADQLGKVRAEIAALKEKEARLVELLKASGPGKHAGHDFTANVIEADRTTVNWKAVAAKLKPSKQLVTAHTNHTVVVSVKCTLNNPVAGKGGAA